MSHAPPASSKLLLICALGIAALLGVLGYGWFRSPRNTAPPPEPTDPDPRLTADTPFLNVRPAVAYVGDAACTSCHPVHGEVYSHHPMGRSLRPVADTPAHARADIRPEGNPFEAMGLQFRIERRGDQIIHRELLRGPDGKTLAETAAPVRFALGSGTRAISYLIDHDGTLTQSPITWFETTKSWDMSPGFKGAPERFERPILAGCLFCHCNLAAPDLNTRSHYKEPLFRGGYAIGCERCHGPGELHVRDRRAGNKHAGADYTIVNPSRLSPELQEAVCAQCHLGGKEKVLRRGRGAWDYRPGLPLESFWRVFVFPPEATRGNRVASHTEQVRVSRCFQKSGGKLFCTTCHDAHSVPAPEERSTYYRDQCLECHQTRGCTEPVARRHAKTKVDDCTVCHMAAEASDISHVALTDHRIPRRPDPANARLSEPNPLVAARLLRPFGHDRVDENDSELMRDLAIAAVGRARSQLLPVRKRVGEDFGPVLTDAVTAHPNDLSARESLALCLAWQGLLPEALEACDDTLAREPRRELALSDAGVIAQQAGQLDRSIGYWRRALDVNPRSTRYRTALAQLLAARGDWEGAAAECRRLLSYDGAHALSRLLLVRYHLQKGDRAAARAELETALALHPPNEAKFRRQFADLLR